MMIVAPIHSIIAAAAPGNAPPIAAAAPGNAPPIAAAAPRGRGIAQLIAAAAAAAPPAAVAPQEWWDGVDSVVVTGQTAADHHARLRRKWTPPIPAAGAVLNRSGFGTVEVAQTPAGALVVKKVFIRNDDYKNEKTAMEAIGKFRPHPCIIELMASDDAAHTITYPLYAKGSLAALLDAHGQQYARFQRHPAQPLDPLIESGDVLSWAIDIALAIEYVQQVHNAAHLDIKPENILVTDALDVVLSDFGELYTGPLPFALHIMTSYFTPPEVRRHQHSIPNEHLYQARLSVLPRDEPMNFDVFSLGCTLIRCLWPGNSALDGCHNVDDTVYVRQLEPTNRRYKRSVNGIPDWFYSLLNKMIEWNPFDRLTASTILECPGLERFRTDPVIRPRWRRLGAHLRVEAESVLREITELRQRADALQSWATTDQETIGRLLHRAHEWECRGDDLKRLLDVEKGESARARNTAAQEADVRRQEIDALRAQAQTNAVDLSELRRKLGEASTERDQAQHDLDVARAENEQIRAATEEEATEHREEREGLTRELDKLVAEAQEIQAKQAREEEAQAAKHTRYTLRIVRLKCEQRRERSQHIQATRKLKTAMRLQAAANNAARATANRTIGAPDQKRACVVTIRTSAPASRATTTALNVGPQAAVPSAASSSSASTASATSSIGASPFAAATALPPTPLPFPAPVTTAHPGPALAPPPVPTLAPPGSILTIPTPALARLASAPPTNRRSLLPIPTPAAGLAVPPPSAQLAGVPFCAPIAPATVRAAAVAVTAGTPARSGAPTTARYAASAAFSDIAQFPKARNYARRTAVPDALLKRILELCYFKINSAASQPIPALPTHLALIQDEIDASGFGVFWGPPEIIEMYYISELRPKIPKLLSTSVAAIAGMYGRRSAVEIQQRGLPKLLRDVRDCLL